MKAWLKCLSCIALSFMFLFSCVGYAAISENLTIFGAVRAEALEPEGLYISAVEVHAASNVSSDSVEIVYPTSLRSTFSANASNASITLKITVHNKTDMTYWYLGIKHDGNGANALINQTNGIGIVTKDGASANATAFDSADWVPPQTERVFYATYTFGSQAQGNRSTLVNFSFGLSVGSVSDGFLKVLNDQDPDSAYGYSYLAGAFDSNYAENRSTVIGNVGEHKEIFDNLFGESITVNVNGESLPVTIMVERENVDGKNATGDTFAGNSALNGCEYTVYITVEDPSNNGEKITVYAVSYTCGADGTWYKIGELYEGTCTVEPYENEDDPKILGFDVDSWRAVYKEYTVVPNLTYKVAYADGEKPEQYNTIAQLMSGDDISFFNRINNFVNGMLTKSCHVVYTFGRNNNGQQIEYENASNNRKAGYAELKRSFDRLKPYLNLDNGASNVRLEYVASTLNRAEIIRMIEDVQAAYDYYCAVNS